jgi:hypothetical protein
MLENMARKKSYPYPNNPTRTQKILPVPKQSYPYPNNPTRTQTILPIPKQGARLTT